MLNAKLLIKELSPPLLWNFLRSAKIRATLKANAQRAKVGSQDLNPYWNEEMAQLLEVWGEGNAWNEIGMFLLKAQGKVLDIACGTGRVITILNKLNPDLDIYGCDISDMLIQKAVDRGISQKNLTICDATNMKMYGEDSFKFAYTIGSLEHFTEDGIDCLVRETKRVVSETSFHMLPVSKKNKNEGWLTNHQSFYNNSVGWWLEKFEKHFENVQVFDSAWSDDISLGKWFVTTKK